MDTGVDYDQILEKLKQRAKKSNLDGDKRSVRILGIVLCRPELTFAKKEIFPSLGHYHRRSQKNVDFYFAGYHEPAQTNVYEMTRFRERTLPWEFDEDAFIKLCSEIESRCKWRYSGGCDFILANYYFGASEEPGLDLENAATFSFERLQRQGKLVTASIFFENIFRHCEKCNGRDGLGRPRKRDRRETLYWHCVQNFCRFLQLLKTRTPWTLSRKLVNCQNRKIHPSTEPMNCQKGRFNTTWKNDR